MRRSQSIRRGLYALVVLVTFMVVLRTLRPDSSTSQVINYEKVVDETHAQHDSGHAGHAAVQNPGSNNKPPLAEQAQPAGPPFDAEAAYKEIVYGEPHRPLVIFSKSYCPHSKKAKELLLEDHSIHPAPKVVELDLHNNGLELQNYIGELTGRRTVPNIMINGISRGGASDLVDLGDQLTAKLLEWGSGELKVEALKAHIQAPQGA